MRGNIKGEISDTRRTRCIEAIIKKTGQYAWDHMAEDQKESLIMAQSLTLRDKFNNVKTTLDGIEFDSKKEAKDYQTELKYMLQAGTITDLEMHKIFVLAEGFTDKWGRKYQPITYEADFYFFAKDYISVLRKQDRDSNKVNAKKVHLENVWVCRDTKGEKTDVYKVKKKLFVKKFPDIYFEET